MPPLENHVKPDIDLDDDAQVDRAMRAAVRAALLDHKRTGDYVVGWENGQIVRIAAEDIIVPEEDSPDL